MLIPSRAKMQATAPSDKPNSRTSLYLSIICTYLVLIVCVQFAWILMLRHETESVIRDIKSGCDSSDHTIAKRQINSVLPVCPPGCVKRRRKRPFGAIARPETNFQPFSEPVFTGVPGERGSPGYSGWPEERGSPGWPGQIGQPGYPGESGWPGERGQSGWPGESGMPGLPGGRGQPGAQGPPGGQGSPGRSGLPGAPGGMGYPGSPGLPGGAGSPGQRGAPGGQGIMGRPGAIGPAGDRGQPGQRGFNYDTYQGPSLRSGQSRGDQRPTEHPHLRNDTSASKLLKEFQLYPHPECKDEVDHRALMDTLKDKGQVSFMIIVDLKGNEYCIVHS